MACVFKIIFNLKWTPLQRQTPRGGPLDPAIIFWEVSMRPTVGLVLMLAVLEKVDHEHKQTNYKRTSINKVYSLELTMDY